jgi:3',5'-cyclic-AMP phosphodiesterase
MSAPPLTRRSLIHTMIHTVGLASFSQTMAVSQTGTLPNAKFRLIHFTDPHIQPEMKATEGVHSCFRQIKKANPDFCLAGGDLIFDALETPKPRAKQLFDLYQESTKLLDCPVYATPGNHDYFGVFEKSGVAVNDPQYGIRMFEDRIGPRYQSFDHKGWHFVLLDTVHLEARQYKGRLDNDQLEWLKKDLAKNGDKPTVVVTHIPIVTAALQLVPGWKPISDSIVVQNSSEIVQVLEKHPVKLVLQGHTHINERVHWKGIDFITTGAVSGNWWKGPRLGFDEGYAVLDFDGPNVNWKFETFGWKADAGSGNGA